jgi:hypothetical protein
MHYAKTAAKVREQIINFSGELSAGPVSSVAFSCFFEFFGS